MAHYSRFPALNKLLLDEFLSIVDTWVSLDNRIVNALLGPTVTFIIFSLSILECLLVFSVNPLCVVSGLEKE